MFSVSTKAQYGIRALVRLARTVEGELSIAELAQAEEISPKYLEGIFSSLKASGLVVSVRGKHGGYRLSRNASLVSMLEIAEALEGKINPVECTGSNSGCTRESGCAPSHFWNDMKTVIETFLASRTLSDIAGK